MIKFNSIYILLFQKYFLLIIFSFSEVSRQKGHFSNYNSFLAKFFLRSLNLTQDKRVILVIVIHFLVIYFSPSPLKMSMWSLRCWCVHYSYLCDCVKYYPTRKLKKQIRVFIHLLHQIPSHKWNLEIFCLGLVSASN